jgi:hypothetical protein
MDYNDCLEAEQLFQELEKYKYASPHVNRLREIFEPIIQNEKDKQFKRQRDIKTTWNNFVPHREVSKTIQCLSNAIHLYGNAKEEIEAYQRETQDILHALEIADLTDEEMATLMKDLQKIRILRRQAKNFVEAVEPLYIYASNNKPLIKELGKVQSEIVKKNETINKKKYRVREKSSLQVAFDEAKPMYERMEKLQLIKTS